MVDCIYVTLSFVPDTVMRLDFLSALMCVSRDECVSFLINKTIEGLIPELKNK